ncbi:MAG TPA: helix-turn-helix domain-containing protein [Gemmatimonadaceae bacterium]|nr:helix-turn-helix domain-containing protein [Gemmatimonadaceae bacterium]
MVVSRLPNLRIVAPEPELQPFINKIWTFESPLGLPPSVRNLAVPNGCSKLTFAYGNSFVSTANGQSKIRAAERLNIIGCRDSSIQLESNPGHIGCIGIEFRPHGALPFFGVPLEEIRDVIDDADVVLGRWGRHLQGGLNDCGIAADRIELLQQELIVQLRKCQRERRWQKCEREFALVGHCVRALESADGLVPIRSLQRTTGYSMRHLETLSRQHVGLSLKTLAGIFRFQRFHRAWARGQPYECVAGVVGQHFYDQSHFSKSFRRMTGYSPGQYFRHIRNDFGRQLSLGEGDMC